MDAESSFIFISSSFSSMSSIHQLTITGERLRSIELDHYPFLRISSLVFDPNDQQLVIVDSFNSVIYSLDPDFDENNVEILLKRSDNVNCPQGLCIGSEGHLIIVECSVTTQHALKIFRYHPCVCHSPVKPASVKTSETTSVRSMTFPYA
jgi:sugar lactone lactonase YvrE